MFLSWLVGFRFASRSNLFRIFNVASVGVPCQVIRHVHIKKPERDLLAVFISSDTCAALFFLQSITISLVLLVFSKRLFIEHCLTNLWTNSLYAVW